MDIKIIVGDKVEVMGELFDTETARAIYDMLPVEGFCNNWGDEFYFEVPLYMPPEAGATCDVEAGDIGYWPPGKAIAVFYGPTPLSRGDKPVPASEVNLIGRIKGDASVLKKGKDETFIRMEKI